MKRIYTTHCGFLYIAVFLALVLPAPMAVRADSTSPSVDAFLYSTMPSTYAHRPDLAMDGDDSTWFRTETGMSSTDFFMVELSRPVRVSSIDVETGDDQGVGAVVDGVVEASADGVSFHPIAKFDAHGGATASLSEPVAAVRIKTKTNLPELDIREIRIGTLAQIGRVQYGPGRGFVDLSKAPDVRVWAAKAEQEMEDFWPDIAARLYSNKFITPNAVTVVYVDEKPSDVAATGAGVMTVNAVWCRHHADDTGLTVHELTHVIQTYENSNAPSWFTEGTADYIRWVRFEPQNFHPRIDVKKATYKDSYRTSAAFLGWCELHYDSRLVTKLNDAARFGRFNEDLFPKYCGKDVQTLWTEFVADYQRDPSTLLTAPIPAADMPRTLPSAAAGASIPVDISTSFNAVGIYADGQAFAADGGMDEGGAAFSANLLGAKVSAGNVDFAIGPAGKADFIRCGGNKIALPAGSYGSVWVLACSVNGASRYQTFTVHYADGSSDTFAQNVSDWFRPNRFPGEAVGLPTAYRNLSTGKTDPGPFYVYRYGFPLNPAKTAQSIILPDDSSVSVLAVTVAK